MFIFMLKAQKQRSYEAIGALSFADSPFACPESAQSNLKSSYDNWINMCVLVFRFQMNHYILYKNTAIGWDYKSSQDIHLWYVYKCCNVNYCSLANKADIATIANKADKLKSELYVSRSAFSNWYAFLTDPHFELIHIPYWSAF